MLIFIGAISFGYTHFHNREAGQMVGLPSYEGVLVKSNLKCMSIFMNEIVIELLT